MERAKEGGARQLAVAYSPPISKDVRPGDPPDSASPFRVTKGAAASWPHGAAAEFPCRPPFTILCSRKGSSSSARSPRERQSRECDRCVKLWPVGRVSLLAAHGFVDPNRETIINTPQRVTSLWPPAARCPPASALPQTRGRRRVLCATGSQSTPVELSRSRSRH
jgi:hypothetical protein